MVPKKWHGEPIYAIRRDMTILGTPQIRLLPEETRNQLIKLQELYFIDDPRGYTDALFTNYLATPPSPPKDDQSDTHNSFVSSSAQESRSPSKRHGSDHPNDDENEGQSLPKRQRTECSLLQRPLGIQSYPPSQTDSHDHIDQWLSDCRNQNERTTHSIPSAV
ncbi:hypothetical protein N7456_012347 [Penicillium angulare]|uniref:Uncharacterized protein n=1 Tax=Penicillium angulare TaxID=116970 RepID=A0A9W9EVP3_9EURO|nr:hypothetical protein N7456_012347 [Penicillium angulare]